MEKRPRIITQNQGKKREILPSIFVQRVRTSPRRKQFQALAINLQCLQMCLELNDFIANPQ